MMGPNDREALQVTLSLGAVQLAIEDLLRVRKGMIIEFESPPLFDVELQVDGIGWVLGQGRLLGNCISVRVLDLVNPKLLAEPQGRQLMLL